MSDTKRDLADISTEIGLSFPYAQSMQGAFYVPPRDAKIVAVPEHLLSGPTARLLSHDPRFRQGLYNHQAIASQFLHAGQNVWVGTTTGSGKSVIPNLHTVYGLGQNPESRYFYVYPSKALQSDQIHDLLHFLSRSGLLRSEKDIGIINGDEKDESARLKVLQEARIVFITPDVMHRWLMGNLAKPEVHNFLVNLKQLFLDETHVYTGLFGRNFSYLIKRLQFAVDTKKRQTSQQSKTMPDPLQIVGASATMKDAPNFMRELTGQTFAQVSRDMDGSPKFRQDVTWYAVDPSDQIPVTKRFVVACLKAGEDAKPGMGISFLYHRQAVERMAAEINHELNQKAAISFVAGYNRHESDSILMQVNYGQCRWMIATPVAEMGVDFRSAVVGTTTGRPMNPASLGQQLGRIGRHEESAMHVFAPSRTFGADDSPTSLRAHAHGELLKNDLLAPNNRIIAYHVVCLAHEMAQMGLPRTASLRDGRYSWGEQFIQTMQRHAAGESIMDPDMEDRLRASRRRSDVHGLLGLRSFELGLPYTMRLTEEDGTTRTIGTLTRPQAIREAYPEARFMRRGTTLKVEGWGRVEGAREYVINMVPSPDTAVTIPIIEKSLYLEQRLKAIPGSHPITGYAGRIMELPLSITEETKGYFIKHHSDGTGGARRFYGSSKEGDDATDAGKTRYRHYSKTSGILIDFRDERLSADQMDVAAKTIRDRYCEMMGIPHGNVDVSTARIFQETRGKAVELPNAIAIYDRGSDKLRLTSNLIASLPKIIETMAHERALHSVHDKLVSFLADLSKSRSGAQPVTPDDPTESGTQPTDEVEGPRHGLHKVMWFDGAFESSERRRRGAPAGPTRVTIEEMKMQGNQMMYRIVPWDDPTERKRATPPTAVVGRWVPGRRLSPTRPVNEGDTFHSARPPERNAG